MLGPEVNYGYFNVRINYFHLQEQIENCWFKTQYSILQLEHLGFINSRRPTQVAFGLKQMKEGERICARCPNSKYSHKLDVMNLKRLLHKTLIFFLLKSFTVQTYITITKFGGMLKM